MSYFGRLVPILWRSAETEATVAATPPLVLYGTFLLHTMHRIGHSAMLRDAIAPDLPTLHRQLEDMTAHHPDPCAPRRACSVRSAWSSRVHDIAPPDW